MPKQRSNSKEEMKRYLGALKEHFEHGVKAIGEQYFDLKKDVVEIKKTQGSHTEMIGRLMIDVAEIKNSLKTKVDYVDFARLEKRVARLEARAR